MYMSTYSWRQGCVLQRQGVSLGKYSNEDKDLFSDQAFPWKAVSKIMAWCCLMATCPWPIAGSLHMAVQLAGRLPGGTVGRRAGITAVPGRQLTNSNTTATRIYRAGWNYANMAPFEFYIVILWLYIQPNMVWLSLGAAVSVNNKKQARYGFHTVETDWMSGHSTVFPWYGNKRELQAVQMGKDVAVEPNSLKLVQIQEFVAIGGN